MEQITPQEEIAGFNALYKLKGIEAAKKFISGGLKIKFDINRPLHRFLVSALMKGYRISDFKEEEINSLVRQDLQKLNILPSKTKETKFFIHKMALRIFSNSKPGDPLLRHPLQRYLDRQMILFEKCKNFLFQQQPACYKFGYIMYRKNGVFDVFMKDLTGMAKYVVRANLQQRVYEQKNITEVYNEYNIKKVEETKQPETKKTKRSGGKKNV